VYERYLLPNIAWPPGSEERNPFR